MTFDTNLRPDELDPERPRPITTPWGTMALYVNQREVLCIQAFCPHLEGPLFEGSVADGAVTCPWHTWRFDLRSGRRIGPFGAPWPGRDRVQRCAVTLGARGTIVLAPPAP